MSRAILAAAAAALGLLVAGCSSGSADAYTACKRAVSAQLAHPDAADFAWTSSTIDKSPSGGWTVTGAVDAKNSFGVTSRLHYMCEASRDGTILSASVR